ncbi:MAG: conjugal transfer protein TraH [Pseudomonadota bacterium]
MGYGNAGTVIAEFRTVVAAVGGGMIMQNRLLVCLWLILLLPSASLAGGLEHMFAKLGAAANHTDPGSFRDQAVGHYTLGGVAVRQKNKAVQPFNVRLPSGIGQGSCGNMDMRFGGMSFMNAREFKEMLQRVGRGLPTYGFQLAMKTFAPQIEGLMSDLRHYLQMINNMTLDDCRMRQSIFDAVLPKQGAMRETLCQDIARGGGSSTDFYGAMSKCRSETQQQSYLNGRKYKDLLTGEYNLVWKVLKRIPKYADDQDVCEFIMSIVGTVISRKEGNTYRLHQISPRADAINFSQAYLEGGESSGLVCDEQSLCLKPKTVKVRISQAQGMTQRVIRVVTSLQMKYLSGAALTKEEQAILGDAYAVPIFKYIQVCAAAHANVILLRDAARFIAISLILTQFDTIAAEIMLAVEELESIQVDASAVKEFKQNLQHARMRIQAMMQKADYEGIWRLNQHIRSLENIIEAATDS